MKKRFRLIRAYEDDWKKINTISLDLVAIERKKVTTPEIIRRTLNIPNLKDILFRDSQLKRIIKRGGGI